MSETKPSAYEAHGTSLALDIHAATRYNYAFDKGVPSVKAQTR